MLCARSSWRFGWYTLLTHFQLVNPAIKIKCHQANGIRGSQPLKSWLTQQKSTCFYTCLLGRLQICGSHLCGLFLGIATTLYRPSHIESMYNSFENIDMYWAFTPKLLPPNRFNGPRICELQLRVFQTYVNSAFIAPGMPGNIWPIPFHT